MALFGRYLIAIRMIESSCPPETQDIFKENANTTSVFVFGYKQKYSSNYIF